MPDLTIERLSLHLSGLSERDGQHLVRLIADGLAQVSVSGGEDHDAIKSAVTASQDVGMREISDRIVADIVRQLDRSA
jgi:hypothetical protein